MDAQTITPHEFNLACDAFYEHPDDSALNEQGNRREKPARGSPRAQHHRRAD
jgi:hypothetical protein